MPSSSSATPVARSSSFPAERTTSTTGRGLLAQPLLGFAGHVDRCVFRRRGVVWRGVVQRGGVARGGLGRGVVPRAGWGRGRIGRHFGAQLSEAAGDEHHPDRRRGQDHKPDTRHDQQAHADIIAP
jgi:hypothetical protein